MTAVVPALAAALAIGCSTAAPSGPEAPQPEEDDLKVLFIGHSLTSWYDMPDLFAELAGAGEHEVFVRTAVKGNATLEDHLADSTTRDLIAAHPWDVVALQDARYRIAFEGIRWELVPFYRGLEDLIRASNPDALILINMWFPLQDGDTVGGTWYPFVTLQEGIWEGTVALADSLDYTVAPVGAAWLRVMSERGDINLFDGDRSHPSHAGAYLQAAIHYAVIFGERPDDLVSPGEPFAVARYLRETAGDLVLTVPNDWNLPGS